MISLALDFAGPLGQMAIADGDKLLHTDQRPAGPGTVEGIVPFLLGGIEQAKLTTEAIDLFIATTGPGSFTGIRAGLAAAHGLALVADRPLFGLTLFEGFALSKLPGAKLPNQQPLLVALDGRRADIFVQLIAPSGDLLSKPANLPPDQLHALVPNGPIALAGSAAAIARDGLIGTGHRSEMLTLMPGSDHVDIAAIALAAHQHPEWSAADPPQPFYGREPDAKPAR